MNNSLNQAQTYLKNVLQDLKIGNENSLFMFSLKLCPACEKMNAILKQTDVSKILKDKEIKYIKVNLDDNTVLTKDQQHNLHALASILGIRMVPQTLFIKNKSILHILSGSTSSDILIQNLKKYF